jgi:intein/homing endonuclease
MLIFDSLENTISYEEVARIIPGSHQVFKLDGDLVDITANDFEVLNEEGLSTYILDLEETDTFALHDNDINIKIVTHNCFPEGTRILLNDGTYKNIEDLTTSDVLLTYDKEQGKYGAGTAGSIRVSTQNELIYIVTENGEEIKSTPLHRFYVEEQGWSHAQDIKVGDSLFNKDGILVKVKSVESLKGEFQVYHLIDVKDNHTYFAEDVLVHNFKIVPSCCFSAGTRITLSNHDEKFIEDIIVGDEVLGWDGEKLVPGEVIAIDHTTTVGDHAERCKVLGDEPSLYTINELGIEFTPEHPFLTKDGWKALSPDPNQEPFITEQEPKSLKVGDFILVNEEWVEIDEIRVVRSNSEEPVYNFTVEGIHSYIADGIVVHNK